MLCHTQGTFACTLGCGLIYGECFGCLKVFKVGRISTNDNHTVVDGD